jgi:hypothetical protein
MCRKCSKNACMSIYLFQKFPIVTSPNPVKKRKGGGRWKGKWGGKGRWRMGRNIGSPKMYYVAPSGLSRAFSIPLLSAWAYPELWSQQLTTRKENESFESVHFVPYILGKSTYNEQFSTA